MGFGVLIQELMQKEKVLLELGELKYDPNPFHKENRKKYIKKEEKIVHMVDRPTSPSKLQRSTTTKDVRYTFPIQPRFIMRDLMKKGLLHPMEKSTQDDDVPMKKLDAHCTFHQRKGNATNFCKALEVAILDLITKGKYQIDQTDANQGNIVNTVSVDKEVYVGLRGGHPRHAPNPITIEQVSIPLDPKTYSMIKKLKTTLTKISLYDLISTSKTHREILYALLKKEVVPTNMSSTMFSKKLIAIKECDVISFYKYEKLNKDFLDECLALYIIPMIDGWEIKRTLVDNGLVVNVCSHKFLIELKVKAIEIPPLEETTFRIRAYDNSSKNQLG